MACFVIIISNNATVFCKGILVFWVLWAPLFRRHQKNLHTFTLGYMDFLLFEAVLLSLKFLVFKCPVFHFLCAFTYGLWKFCFGYFMYGMGGGWVCEMQNKAIAQPAWLQLVAGATAGAQLSLAQLSPSLSYSFFDLSPNIH